MPFDLGFSFNLDLSWLFALGNKPFYYIFWFFFSRGGWVIFLLVWLWGSFELFVLGRQNKFAAKQKYIFLAIDIPKLNLQSPKAVENIFATLAGAHSPLEWEEEIFEGKFQLGFSLEIVSIEGNVQYIIRTPVQWRTMVEAAIYAQYPDAEMTEVKDYTSEFNLTFPNDEYNLWGSDLKLYADQNLPIRTYPEFEHPMSKDIKDPMASLLEVLNKMQKGEHFWLQILIYPTDTAWAKVGQEAIKKLIGRPTEAKKTFLDKVIGVPIAFVEEVVNGVIGGAAGVEEKKERPLPPWLPPVEKIQAEAIARKIGKIGFKSKFRIVYLAKKEVYNAGLGVSATFGAIKQYSDLNLNGFKPDFNKTVARWPFFKASRLAEKQRIIFKAFKARTADRGGDKFILNIEELASLYHFPFIETYSPLVKRIESKKGSAPIGLPLAEVGETIVSSNSELKAEKKPVIDYDDDYFEKRFAHDKSGESDRERKAQILKKMKKTNSAEAVLPPVASEYPPASEASGGDDAPTNLPFSE
jgi:hypothetical protein